MLATLLPELDADSYVFAVAIASSIAPSSHDDISQIRGKQLISRMTHLEKPDFSQKTAWPKLS
jgi:hypothetical protein